MPTSTSNPSQEQGSPTNTKKCKTKRRPPKTRPTKGSKPTKDKSRQRTTRRTNEPILSPSKNHPSDPKSQRTTKRPASHKSRPIPTLLYRNKYPKNQTTTISSTFRHPTNHGPQQTSRSPTRPKQQKSMPSHKKQQLQPTRQ